MQWSLSDSALRLDVCSSVKERLHQRQPFVTKQPRDTPTNLCEFTLVTECRPIEWRPSVVACRLDIRATVKESLPRRPSSLRSGGGYVDEPLRFRHFHEMQLDEVESIPQCPSPRRLPHDQGEPASTTIFTKRRASTNRRDFGISTKCCPLKWSPFITILCLDVCSTAKENLHRQAYITRRRCAVPTNLCGCRMSLLHCLMQRRVSVEISRLDIYGVVKENLLDALHPFETAADTSPNLCEFGVSGNCCPMNRLQSTSTSRFDVCAFVKQMLRSRPS